MTTTRPPSGTPSYPEKMINPIFPPMSSHPNGNGMTPTGNAPTLPIQYPPPTQPPIFPPNLSHSPNNFSPSAFPKTNPILSSPSTMHNPFPPAPSAPATLNTSARATPPIQPPSMFTTNVNSTPTPTPTPPPQPPQMSQLHQMPQQPILPSVPAPGPTLAPQVPAPMPMPQAPPSILSSQPPYTLNTNGAAPPPPPLMPTSYNSAPTRPMYPSPATLYQSPPTMTTRPSYPNPNQNSPYASNSMPPPPAPVSQYPSNSVPGHPGQPPMPYATGAIPPQQQQQQQTNNLNHTAYNNDMVDLLKEKRLVSPFAEEPPISPLLSEENQQMNCSPEVMRCSLNVIPQTKDLLNKSRLPLGILIHPFKDLESLSVIQGTKIVRCDGCKSYINPFVTFLDNTRWRCSICSRVNDLPQEFLFDPITKTYGDPSRRPEVRFGTVEYTATADYMARPPQPAMYLFLLDVSHNAIQTGYLQSFCDILSESLNTLPGDARTQIGFITYDSRLHFYDLSDRHNGSFRVMIMPDLDDKPEDALPLPDGLMVTLGECRAVVESFLQELPKLYHDNNETDSALGAALQIAQKLLSPTGGRVTVIQTRIPNLNPGALVAPVTASGGSGNKEPSVVAPTSDYYKKLSLDYASFQIACDLFLLNTHHVDIATLSCIAKYSAGEVKYYPGFHTVQTPHEVERFENDLRRYLQRKIGFEAVMRLRCPPAFSIHTFYGNGFVRSVDLLVLPNINPDAAFGIQVAIEDTLVHYKSATFQVALLYTSSKGERRIRVHTLSLPISSNLNEIFANADQEAVVSVVAKMAADRSMTSSISDAREAMSNVACDVLRACLANNSTNRVYSFMVPYSLRLIPLYMLSMMKSTAFRAGSLCKLDDRAFYLDLCKTLPIPYLMQIFYPDLYPIHTIEDKSQIIQDGEEELYIPQRSHLSYAHIDSHGAYILDTSEYIYIYIGKAISDHFVQNVFNVPTFSSLPYDAYSLPEFENPLSMKIHNFLSYLIQSRPHGVGIHIMREDSSHRHVFTRHLVDDKSESSVSYEEFFRHIRDQINK